MEKQHHIASPVSGILAMDPDNYFEINGVVLDRESFERHRACESPLCETETPAPVSTSAPIEETAPVPCAQPQPGVFVADPVHVGWYPTQQQKITYPIMAGPVFPCGSGSGSGSYLSSYLSSWLLSSGSWLYGSGSWILGSGSGSGALCAGFGLELI